jgi:8-oxo-dGTP pyrophosphatase MutT (NUDIX family)
MPNFKKPAVEETDIGATAILISKSNKILLQERDDNPNIYNPGMIGMFGGTINKSETIESGLIRELKEEIGINIKDFRKSKLGVFYKTKEQDGIDYKVNVFIIKNVPIKSLKITEGKLIVLRNEKTILENTKLSRITKLALTKYFEEWPKSSF